MFLFLFLLFTAVPVLELMLLFRAGAMFGALPTLGIVILTGIVGAYLARTQGRQILFDIQQRLQAGEIPEYQMIAGVLVFAGGMLLLTPGFITDILGLSMIFPVTRFLIIKFLRAQFEQAIASGSVQFRTFGNGAVFTSGGPTTPKRPPSANGLGQSRIIDVKKIED